MKIFFVDDQVEEVIHQWKLSGCESLHELLPIESFDSIERTCLLVKNSNPDVILVGYGLGKYNVVTGVDVIKSIRSVCCKRTYIIANSGGGWEQFSQVAIDGIANRNPKDLNQSLRDLVEIKRETLEEMSPLRGLIYFGQTKQAIELIQFKAENYKDAENFVFDCFQEKYSSPELREAVLKVFLNTRVNCYPQHGYWVHSLSHFIDLLWESKMYKWIARFYEVAFKGANELGDSNCSRRLIYEFVNRAKHGENPKDFHITVNNVDSWMDWWGLSDFRARIKSI